MTLKIHRHATKKCFDCETLIQSHNRRCSSCYHKSLVENFCQEGHNRKIGGVSKSSNCIECSRVRAWKRYGIKNSDGSFFTTIDYDREYQIQQGRCANKLCNVHQTEIKRRFHVDHDHATGIFRGLLCSNCNNVKASVGVRCEAERGK